MSVESFLTHWDGIRRAWIENRLPSRIVRLGRFLGHSGRFGEVVGVDIKQAIREVAWMSRMTTAASDGDVFKKAIRNLRIKKQLESIDAWADMAKAALAYAEYRMDNEHDAPVDGATYIRERGKLWNAFVSARAKAANQS